KSGSNMFVDLANLCMFCHALEVPTKVVSKAVLGFDDEAFKVGHIKATVTPVEPSTVSGVEEGLEYLAGMASALVDADDDIFVSGDGCTEQEHKDQDQYPQLEIGSTYNLRRDLDDDEYDTGYIWSGTVFTRGDERVTPDSVYKYRKVAAPKKEPVLTTGVTFTPADEPVDGSWYTVKVGDINMIYNYQFKESRNMFIPTTSSGNRITTASAISAKRADVTWELLERPDTEKDPKKTKPAPSKGFDDGRLVDKAKYHLTIGEATLKNEFQWFEETARFRELSSNGRMMLEGKAFTKDTAGLSWELIND
ncbi:hypothetical protein ACRXCV_00005, partial (plasmid) [Halobacteriovorax sp. GFR7]